MSKWDCIVYSRPGHEQAHLAHARRTASQLVNQDQHMTDDSLIPRRRPNVQRVNDDDLPDPRLASQNLDFTAAAL